MTTKKPRLSDLDHVDIATGESADVRQATYEESEGWYSGITSDMFGQHWALL